MAYVFSFVMQGSHVYHNFSVCQMSPYVYRVLSNYVQICFMWYFPNDLGWHTKGIVSHSMCYVCISRISHLSLDVWVIDILSGNRPIYMQYPTVGISLYIGMKITSLWYLSNRILLVYEVHYGNHAQLLFYPKVSIFTIGFSILNMISWLNISTTYF